MTLTDKLNPNRFTNMSGKMSAILGYVLGECWTEPEIGELHLTVDGFLLAQRNGDVGCNDFIGAMGDFVENVTRLFDIAELTSDEKRVFWMRWQEHVKDWGKDK